MHQEKGYSIIHHLNLDILWEKGNSIHYATETVSGHFWENWSEWSPAC